MFDGECSLKRKADLLDCSAAATGLLAFVTNSLGGAADDAEVFQQIDRRKFVEGSWPRKNLPFG